MQKQIKTVLFPYIHLHQKTEAKYCWNEMIPLASKLSTLSSQVGMLTEL